MPPKTPRQSGASTVAAAATTPTQLTYSFKDIVLAKVKGHPAWPARVIDPHKAPMNLRDERKIAQKNSYLVKFFKTADYAWMNAKEISRLEPPEIRAFVDNPNKKGADLKAAYQIALAPEVWEAEQEAMQREHEEELKAMELDELDPTENGEEPMLPPSKTKQKRKRASETKTPAASTKKRKSEVLSTNGSVDASATPEPASAPAVKKRSKKKDEAPPVVDGETAVREWRHKLQRVFLGKSEATEKMMPEIDGVFKDIEEFEMKTEWLTSSKLGKVLKRVGVLEDNKVPLDDKYHIRARARALQEKWRQTLGIGEEIAASRTQPVESKNEVTADSKPAATRNGMNPSVTDDNKPSTENEASHGKAAVTKDVPMPEEALMPEEAPAVQKTSAPEEVPSEDSGMPDGPKEDDAMVIETGKEHEAVAAEAAEEEDTMMDVEPPVDTTKPTDSTAEVKTGDKSTMPHVNGGAHSVDEDKDAVNGVVQNQPDEEIVTPMPDSSIQKSDVNDNGDDDDQMDCDESPEPTAEANEVDGNESEKEVAD